MRVFRSRLAAWLLALISIAFVTEIGRLAGLNPSTVGFAYLIVVLLISLWGGLLVGTVSSVVATLCYNFFFFPPLYTLTLADPANWFALAAFLIASVTVNRLVVAARIQAEAAEQRRKELEALSIERERFLEENAHLHALRESEALKTSLLRAISHDLTTPITAITLRTESLRRHAADDADLLEDLSAIAEETSRLRRRIDNLLSMARLEAGKAMPHREPTPPAESVLRSWIAVRGFPPVRPATSRSEALDSRSHAAWQRSTTAASGSRRDRAEARSRASIFQQLCCRCRKRRDDFQSDSRRGRRPVHSRIIVERAARGGLHHDHSQRWHRWAGRVPIARARSGSGRSRDAALRRIRDDLGRACIIACADCRALGARRRCR